MMNGHRPSCSPALPKGSPRAPKRKPMRSTPIRCEPSTIPLNPAFATLPGNRLLSLLFATLPKTCFRKSFVCHTCDPLPPTSRGDECRVLPGRAFAGDAKVANAPISSPTRSCCFRASLKQCCRTWGRVVTTEMRVTYT